MSNDDNGTVIHPIGIIRSPHVRSAGTPIQPTFARDATGEVIVDERFAAGLEDLDGFDRIWLLFHLHRARPFNLKVVPFWDTVERGLFSTRAPSRPNPVGISAVELLSREGNVLHVRGLDILDGTPLIDIKPYVPKFDSYPSSRAGWIDTRKEQPNPADDRFGYDRDD